MNDKLDVIFQSAVSDYSDCLCSCCHDTAEVLKLRIPESLYYNGKKLTTKYHGLWICKTCAKKMISELNKLLEDGAE